MISEKRELQGKRRRDGGSKGARGRVEDTIEEVARKGERKRRMPPGFKKRTELNKGGRKKSPRSTLTSRFGAEPWAAEETLNGG